MHWCPDCNQPCYCDIDDTDFGVLYCNSHLDCLEERNEFEYDDEEEPPGKTNEKF